MQDTGYFYEPSKGHGLSHDPLKAIVAPRPIAWISTVDSKGQINLAPYSFFNMLSSFPPMVYFSSERTTSDSLRNCRETGEFVVNVVTFDLGERMSATSAPEPHGTDEMKMVGLSPAPCHIVKAPRLEESPASLECKVLKIERLVGLDGKESTATMVFGQIVGVHIDPQFLNNGQFDTAGAELLGRCGYLADYAVVNELAKIKRPTQIPDDWPYERRKSTTPAEQDDKS